MRNIFPVLLVENFGNAAAGKTVKMYLDEYLEICETRKLSPSTIGGYKNAVVR